MSDEFLPDWVSAPSDTILDIIEEKRLSIQKVFFKDLGLSEDDSLKLIFGTYEINEELAEKLSKTLGASKEFWMNREKNYRNDLERLGAKK